MTEALPHHAEGCAKEPCTCGAHDVVNTLTEAIGKLMEMALELDRVRQVLRGIK